MKNKLKLKTAFDEVPLEVEINKKNQLKISFLDGSYFLIYFKHFAERISVKKDDSKKRRVLKLVFGHGGLFNCYGGSHSYNKDKPFFSTEIPILLIE